MSKYVQYGCGQIAPDGWLNFDVSPTLRLQRVPLLRLILKPYFDVHFPKNAKYGNIVKGLPGISENSCDAVFSSHVLEHISLNSCRIALKNTYKILKPDGVFRVIIPDLWPCVEKYIKEYKQADKDASINFINCTMMGTEKRLYGFKAFMKANYGSEAHLWMWDKYSFAEEIRKVGFKSVKPYSFTDKKDKMFELVEEEERFRDSLAFEAIK
ncbi:MAG: methyltransferase domain-containing protein [Bacteroidales bacterium]|nr:methyltransferase domain-containing protein [Bacteroidales bacterium]